MSSPSPGDVVILLGGRTGRDGCGGATGSSKAHKLESLETCGAEVQKGNAPVGASCSACSAQGSNADDQALQRLRRGGGVSVAIGELADGLSIDLNAVPKNMTGWTAPSLPSPRARSAWPLWWRKRTRRNSLPQPTGKTWEATVVAEVTAEPRLVMRWNGNIICDIKRQIPELQRRGEAVDVRVPARSVDPESAGGHA